MVEPPAVEPGVMAVFGVIALAGNAVSVLVLSRVRDGNLNTRAAMLEVASDALGAGAVLVAAAVIALTGWSPSRWPIRPDARSEPARPRGACPDQPARRPKTAEVYLMPSPGG